MRAKPLFKTRFVVRPGLDADSDHWLGGTGDFNGAICSSCQHQLLLVLDLNCDDPVLRKASRGKFGKLRRLPLFICARCHCQLSYRVDEKRQVKVVKTRYGNPQSGPAYADYPDHFPRKQVALDTAVPPALSQIIRKWNFDADPCGELLTKNDRQILDDHFGHPIFVPRFMYHHQVGGESIYPSWDDSAFECPNKKCPAGIWNTIMKRGRPMRFLAGILNDPPGGLPLIEPLNEKTRTKWNYFVSYYFQICDKCLTITASSSSD